MGTEGADPVPGVAGLVLTGGASRRMGADKATVVVGGISLAQRAARTISTVCRPALEVGPGHTGLPVVREDPPGSGPLAAVAAGGAALRARGHHGPAMVVAVDLPAVTDALLRVLASLRGEGSVVPVVDGTAQPLCARYSPAALVRAERLSSAGARSMRALLEELDDVDWAGPEVWGAVAGAEAFADVDTPEDLRQLGGGLPHAGPVRE